MSNNVRSSTCNKCAGVLRQSTALCFLELPPYPPSHHALPLPIPSIYTKDETGNHETHASGASRPPKLEEAAGIASAMASPGELVTAGQWLCGVCVCVSVCVCVLCVYVKERERERERESVLSICLLLCVNVSACRCMCVSACVHK